jgi:hypothetical protein
MYGVNPKEVNGIYKFVTRTWKTILHFTPSSRDRDKQIKLSVIIAKRLSREDIDKLADIVLLVRRMKDGIEAGNITEEMIRVIEGEVERDMKRI